MTWFPRKRLAAPLQSEQAGENAIPSQRKRGAMALRSEAKQSPHVGGCWGRPVATAHWAAPSVAPSAQAPRPPRGGFLNTTAKSIHTAIVIPWCWRGHRSDPATTQTPSHRVVCLCPRCRVARAEEGLQLSSPPGNPLPVPASTVTACPETPRCWQTPALLPALHKLSEDTFWSLAQALLFLFLCSFLLS